MNENHLDFVGAAPTIKFLKQCNTAFDILNSKDIKHKDIYKRPMNPENKRVVADFLQTFMEYLKSLQIITETKETKKIVYSRNRTAFLGIIVSIHGLIQFYEEYVEKIKMLPMIRTYFLQQDFLEMFFGRIRSKNGFNNNPNIQQFKRAFRKLLCNIKIETPELGNCRIFERELPTEYLYSNVFTVSSKKTRTTFEDIREAYEAQQEEILISVFDMDQIQINDPLLETTTNYRIAYVAKQIETKLANRFDCSECMMVFEKDLKVTNTRIGIQSMPCRRTFKICQHVDKFMKLHDIRQGTDHKQIDFRVSYCLMFRTLDLNELYKDCDFQCGNNHKYSLIKSIILQYVAIKSTYLSQQITFQNYDNICRQYYNKLTIFRGQ